ncbi:YraN family protein [Celerinatantimonas sp. YJH-8]|uniref:YraN family protein n=1 Tax=Celerinatantimonas sp. YJH-8 TaxID=3228714 RepID=UPI0038CABB7A
MANWSLFSNKQATKSAPSRREIGNLAETQACHFLKKKGIHIIERNYCCRGGELDIIAKEQETLIFVEVRMRKNRQYGGALISVTPQKQRHLYHAAQCYLQQKQLNPARLSIRFDIIAIEHDPEQIQWVKNAFGEPHARAN